jgi:hypothetical protein
MALNYKTGNAARSAAANALTARLNSGRIEIRTGSPPTNVADASSGTLLGTCTFGATAFGSATNGVASSNSITSDSSADNSGTAGYFRNYASGAADTAADGQGTAGVSADTTDMTFDNKVIVAGGVIAISSMTLTVPVQ